MKREVGSQGDIVLIGLGTSALDGPYSDNTTQAPPPGHTPHADVGGFKMQGAIGEPLPISYRKILPKHHQADKKVLPGVFTEANIKRNTWNMVRKGQ